MPLRSSAGSLPSFSQVGPPLIRGSCSTRGEGPTPSPHNSCCTPEATPPPLQDDQIWLQKAVPSSCPHCFLA